MKTSQRITWLAILLATTIVGALLIVRQQNLSNGASDPSALAQTYAKPASRQPSAPSPIKDAPIVVDLPPLDPLPAELPQGGVRSDYGLDKRQLAYREEVRAILHFMMGFDLPGSASEFGLDRGFRMTPVDARMLVTKLQELQRARVGKPGLMDHVTVGEPERSPKARSRFALGSGYRFIQITFADGAKLFSDRKPFTNRHEYVLRLMKTAAGQFPTSLAATSRMIYERGRNWGGRVHH